MIPKVATGFRKRSCSNKEVERDDDSSRSHRALAAEAADGSALDRLADILLRSDVPSDLREAARDVHSLLLAAAMAGRRNSGPARHRPPGWGRDFARERGALRPRLHANLPVPACDAACPAGRARTLLRAAARHTLRRLRAICAPRASSDPPVQPARRAVYADRRS